MHSFAQQSYFRRYGVTLRSRALCKQAANLLLWADCHFLSITAAHIPSLQNHGTDILPRKEIPQGEWRLPPKFGTATGEQRWICSPRARMRTAHCSSPCLTPPLEGDVPTSRWPSARLYAFPLIKILPLVLYKIREERASVTLITLNWPN